LLAQVVSVEGVVSGDFQGSDGLNGFFMQDPDGDSNEQTSDGIFVFAPSSLDISVGDRVRVKGIVAEYYELTEISSVSSLLFCETSLPVEPVPVDLSVTAANDLEIYEGMLVTIPEALTVTEHYELGRYGELSLSANGRLYNPTNDQGATVLENSLRRLVLDDSSSIENPALVPYLAADNTLRLGDTISGLTGSLTYSYGEYTIEPTLSPEIIRVNERPAAPDDNGGVITIASFNVLNYFTTIDDGVNDARGADSLEEFERQKAKLVSAILTMNADVVGLMEIENNGDIAVEDLVSGLNAASTAGAYAAVPQPVVGLGDDAIKVALIYKPASVTPIGVMMTDEDPIFSRPPAAQTFSAYGEVFSVVVNHFKSKGCTDATGLDEDQGDGQGCYNYTRTLQAQQLLVFIENLKQISGDEDVLVIGDLNSYGQEDPIDILTASGLINQIAAYVPLEERYSYVYYGEAGYLDHALSTTSMDSLITGVDIWHINADEPVILDYNTEYNPPELYNADPFRSSDHDPVVISMCEGIPPTLQVELSQDELWPPNNKMVYIRAYVETEDNYDENVTLTLVSVTSNETNWINNYGHDKSADIIILDDFNFKLRAEKNDFGQERVYTITYLATDSCGNSTLVSKTVTVPKSKNHHYYFHYFYKFLKYLHRSCKSQVPVW
jgi:predicted extracellular nuclease